MKRNWHIAGLYLLQNLANNTYYVGQTKDMAIRYDPETRNRCVAFVDERNQGIRLFIEQEAIEFCEAFGLPITNKQRSYGKSPQQAKYDHTWHF